MPNFNLNDYELVEDRIRAFYSDHPDGRIVTWDQTSDEDRARGYFIVRAQVYLDHEDQHMNCPKATGLAFEIEGTAGANKTSALENAETSAIGRALANCDYAKGKRPSQTEMTKVQANPVPDEFLVRVDASVSEEELKALWSEALEGGFSQQVAVVINKRKKAINV
jgi:hypothetical protein